MVINKDFKFKKRRLKTFKILYLITNDLARELSTYSWLESDYFDDHFHSEEDCEDIIHYV